MLHALKSFRNRLLILSRFQSRRMSTVHDVLIDSKSVDVENGIRSEVEVGISEYVVKTKGFSGILKHRYSDFVVREVNEVGKIAELTNFENYKDLFTKKSTQVQDICTVDDNINTFINGIFLNAEIVIDPENIVNIRKFLQDCCQRKSDCVKNINAFECTSKELRTQVHQLVRKYFEDFVDSETAQENSKSYIILNAKHLKQKADKKRFVNTWPENVGDYLKFVLLKENVDTQSAINTMSKFLHCQPNSFQYAGTKDKRGITTQWCTLYRQKPESLLRLNKFRFPPLIRVGNFEFVNEPIKLGKLSGNRFDIILRNLTSTVSDEDILFACNAMATSGFINYFGLQRFGKGGSRSHEFGRAIFKGDWKLAVHMLFTPKASDRQEIVDAKLAFSIGDFESALQRLPDQMYVEKTVLEKILKSKTDYAAAYQAIPKNIRLLCAHAYQSYLWNLAASARIREYGLQCIAGDIVVLNPTVLEVIGLGDDVDEDILLHTSDVDVWKGETTTSNNSSNGGGSTKTTTMNIHIVTEEEVISGKYTISDVFLPLVGYDVMFPTHSIGAFYQTMLAADGLSLSDFKTKVPTQYRMAGTYRKLIEYPKDFKWELRRYQLADEEILDTELTSMRGTMAINEVKDKDRSGVTETSSAMSITYDPSSITSSSTNNTAVNKEIDRSELNTTTDDMNSLRALRLTFTLPPGTYATMMLREITKESTESHYQSQLSSTSDTSTSVNLDHHHGSGRTMDDEDNSAASKHARDTSTMSELKQSPGEKRMKLIS